MGREVGKNIQSIAREMEWPSTELSKENQKFWTLKLAQHYTIRIKTFYYFLRPVMKISMASQRNVDLLSLEMLNHVWLCKPMDFQHSRLPCPSPTPRACSNSRSLSHPTISSSVFPFSSHLQSFPASGYFQMSQFFPSGGQSIGVSASASVTLMIIQDLFPLGWTGWISLQSKALSRVFSNTTVQKHRFFDAQLSL